MMDCTSGSIRLVRRRGAGRMFALLALCAGGFGCHGVLVSPSGVAGKSDLPLATTVITIVLENQDYADIVGSPNAPFINWLIATYGLATNYQDSGKHPSLPNYLEMVSGETHYPGLIDIGPKQAPFFPTDDDYLGSQLEQSGLTWRSYQEGMGTPCLLDDSGEYATRHNPFVYFSQTQTSPHCKDRVVDYAQFRADLDSGGRAFMWITPNLLSDGHDPQNDPAAGLRQSDAWCQSEVTHILESPIFQAGGVLFLTWDEAEGRNGHDRDRVPMIVISPFLSEHGKRSSVPYSHASYLATVEDLLWLPRLDSVVNERTLAEFLR